MARIAVIGVHGVADQKPGETVRAVARALQAESAATGSVYSEYIEEKLCLPVKKMHLSSPPCGRTLPAKLKESRSFDERSPYLRWLHGQTCDRNELVRHVEADANIEFMYDQVCYYDPRHSQDPDHVNRIYDTVRWRGQRVSKSSEESSPPDEVDIYEFHWADLSRLAGGVVNILSAFYQLLFHVCSLGRDTLDLAKPECDAAGSSRRFQWTVVRWCHSVVTLCLSLIIPVVTLCLMGVLLIILPAKVPPSMEVPVSLAGVGAVIVTGGLIARMLRAARPDQPPGRYGMVLAGTLLAICCMVYSPELVQALIGRGSWEAVAWKKILAVEWGFVSSAGIGAMLIWYATRKPQVLIIGPMLWLPIAAIVSLLVYRAEPTQSGLARAAISTSVILLLVLHVAWIIMAVAMLIAGLMTMGSWFRLGRGSRLDRAFATGFISMIAPATLFAFVTLALYSPLLSLANVPFFRVPHARLELLIFGQSIPGLQDATLHEAIHWMFQLSVTWLADGILLVWGGSAFLILCNFFWAVWAESKRPTSRPADRSQFIGETLSNAFGSLGMSVGLLTLAFPVVFLAGTVINWVLWQMGTPPREPRGVFALLGAAVFGLVATGKMGVVLDRVWPALDVILDVDNYLQGRPWDCNPKGRIATRFVALLRFIAQQKYDRIVFVAHSQGSVITSDLLRFLRFNPDPALAPIGFGEQRQRDERHPFPLALLTIGCPLRQLYGWRFPHLYRWVRHEGTSEGAAAGSSAIGLECRPNPRELGLSCWINAYCSGDYVGRHLWRDDNLARPTYNAQSLFAPWVHNPAAESRDESVQRRELCLGAGAHTHYFDDNASDFARLVDGLIGDLPIPDAKKRD